MLSCCISMTRCPVLWLYQHSQASSTPITVGRPTDFWRSSLRCISPRLQYAGCLLSAWGDQNGRSKSEKYSSTGQKNWCMRFARFYERYRFWFPSIKLNITWKQRKGVCCKDKTIRLPILCGLSECLTIVIVWQLHHFYFITECLICSYAVCTHFRLSCSRETYTRTAHELEVGHCLRRVTDSILDLLLSLLKEGFICFIAEVARAEDWTIHKQSVSFTDKNR